MLPICIESTMTQERAETVFSKLSKQKLCSRTFGERMVYGEVPSNFSDTECSLLYFEFWSKEGGEFLVFFKSFEQVSIFHHNVIKIRNIKPVLNRMQHVRIAKERLYKSKFNKMVFITKNTIVKLCFGYWSGCYIYAFSSPNSIEFNWRLCRGSSQIIY